MSWQPIEKCSFCGSCAIRVGSPCLDHEAQGDELPPETWTCDDCGCGGGGAAYWQ